MRPVVLISACLLGCRCRYDGKSKLREEIIPLHSQVQLVPVCPEQLGGLATPRPASERRGDTVVTQTGANVTAQYHLGAVETLRLAQCFGCHAVLLKERSPSCGADSIYDGSFSGRLIPGDGVTAELLKENGIPVFGESQIPALMAFLQIQ